MDRWHMVSPLSLKSPAKINLTLDIVSRREDGYHELVSLVCPIGLYDEVCLSPATRLEVVCHYPGVPGDETNLAYRAARLFLDRIDRGGAFRIDLTKRIPVGAGLGGGSGNAATVLVGLNRLYGEPLTQDALVIMGGQLGADVPFFVLCRPVVAMGIGERLAAVGGLPQRWAVVVYPGFGISTRQAYEGLCRNVSDPNLALTKSENLHKSLLLKVRNGPPECYLSNDLEAAMLPRHPALAEAKRALVQNGALGALMTGSG
ncbi:MAG: 4-(cytidine 5'-diphospho)-2-C-methyl-D-erythritol kinase, partial [Pseudomonadota bacterium]